MASSSPSPSKMSDASNKATASPSPSRMSDASNKATASPSPSKMSDASNKATASPKRIIKRKAPTEADMFTPAKRIKYDASKSAFAEIWQQDLQKARDEMPLRPDELMGVIVPPKFMPRPIISAWKGTQQFDDNRTRKWASLNKDKARVIKHKHVSEAWRDRALASFPKVEARKKEEEQDRLKARKVMLEDMGSRIERFRKRIEEAKKSPKQVDKIKLPKIEFLLQCWKNLNYAAIFQPGPLEHKELKKYGEDFVRTWTAKQSKFWRPQFKEDKKRACVVMEWVYRRV